jgi:hypothetical protein
MRKDVEKEILKKREQRDQNNKDVQKEISRESIDRKKFKARQYERTRRKEHTKREIKIK